MENKKMTETDINRFINMFNKDFKCKIENGDFKFLIDLFENYINLEISDPSESRIYESLEELDERLNQKLDDEGKKLFKNWNKIQDEYLLDTAEQAFIYGFCVCKQLEMETRIGGDSNE